jgi:hypothetical protein
MTSPGARYQHRAAIAPGAGRPLATGAVPGMTAAIRGPDP